MEHSTRQVKKWANIIHCTLLRLHSSPSNSGLLYHSAMWWLFWYAFLYFATQQNNKIRDLIRSVRSHLPQPSSFTPKNVWAFREFFQQKEEGQSWSVKVVILHHKDSTQVPHRFSEREILVSAGSFPKLKTCGGFDLMRCIPNTKELAIVSAAATQSSLVLKTMISNGRIFVRPIQQNLSLEAEKGKTPQAVVCLCVCALGAWIW